MLTTVFDGNPTIAIIDLTISLVIGIICMIFVARKVNRIIAYVFYPIALLIISLAYVFQMNLLLTITEMCIIIFSSLVVTINASEYRYLLLRNTTLKSKKEKTAKVTSDDVYKTVAEAVRSLSRTKTGAIITFEKSTPLDNVIKNGTIINAPVSAELLMTIFYPGTRLHDGAVVIRGNTIIAASVYYSPTTRALTGKYGSRHRAAVGISEISDAVTIVVSEETGRISLAYKAKLESSSFDSFLDDFTDLMNDKD